MGSSPVIHRQTVGVRGMGLLQVEQIRETLQEVLSEHSVIVQVNQFRNQLNIILNKPPGTIAHYAALVDLLKSRLGQFHLDDIDRIKIIGRIQGSPKSDWEEVIDLRPTPLVSQPTYASSAPWVVAIAAGVVSLLVIFSYHMGQWQQQQRMQSLIGAASSRQTVTLADYKWHIEGGAPFLVGVLKNYSEDSFRLVQADFELFDKGGQRVGQVSVQVYGLGPEETWHFREPVGNLQAVRARLLKLQSFL
ncbi:FxLYD domain-containing protein [Parathermosynechococcus lividus]